MPPLSCPFNAVSHTGTDFHTSLKGCKPYITSVIKYPSPTAHLVIMRSSIIANTVHDVSHHTLAADTITTARLTHLPASLLQGSHNHSAGLISPASTMGTPQHFSRTYQMAHKSEPPPDIIHCHIHAPVHSRTVWTMVHVSRCVHPSLRGIRSPLRLFHASFKLHQVHCEVCLRYFYLKPLGKRVYFQLGNIHWKVDEPFKIFD